MDEVFRLLPNEKKKWQDFSIVNVRKKSILVLDSFFGSKKDNMSKEKIFDLFPHIDLKCTSLMGTCIYAILGRKIVTKKKEKKN